MRHTAHDQAKRHENSPTCIVWEFGASANGAIDGAEILINGRYPEAGYARNEVSSFSLRVLGGAGLLATRNEHVLLAVGDVATLDAGEEYYFEGKHLLLFMACSPAFSPDQYTAIAD